MANKTESFAAAGRNLDKAIREFTKLLNKAAGLMKKKKKGKKRTR
jgi:hypothetical protein